MGRIKTSLIKRVGLDIMNNFGDKVSQDYEQNKKLVEELTGISSKKLRNIIAGYITRLSKKRVA